MSLPPHKPHAAAARRAQLLSAALDRRQRTIATHASDISAPEPTTTSHRRTTASTHTTVSTTTRDRAATPALAVSAASSAASAGAVHAPSAARTTSSTSTRRAASAASSTGARAVSSSSHSASAALAASASSNKSQGDGGISTGAAVGVSVIGALVVLGGAFFALRYYKARRARAATNGFGGYVRRTSEDYVSTTSGSLRKKGDHQSFGNMAPLGEKMEMQETESNGPYTVGMARDEWDLTQHQPASADRLYPNSAGDGSEGVFAAQQHNAPNAGYLPSPYSQTASPSGGNTLPPTGSPTAPQPQPYPGGAPSPPADPRSSANAPYYAVPGGHLSSYYDSDSGQAAFAMPQVAAMPQPQPDAQHAGGQARGLGFGDLPMESGAYGAAGVGHAAVMGGAQQQEVLAMPQPHLNDQQYQQLYQQQQETQAMGIGGAILTGLAVTSDEEDEESPFGDPAERGKVFVVKRTFEPSMADELVITPGDRVEVLMSYDDGWCLGINLDSPPDPADGRPARGVFPRDCVEQLSGATGLARVPTLPPLDLGEKDLSASERAAAAGAGPTIQVSHPAAGGRFSMLDEDHREVLDQFPPPANSPTAPAFGSPGVSGSWSSPVGAAPPTLSAGTTGSAGKRVSSLIASRDAELFLALGQALDDRATPGANGR